MRSPRRTILEAGCAAVLLNVACVPQKKQDYEIFAEQRERARQAEQKQAVSARRQETRPNPPRESMMDKMRRERREEQERASAEQEREMEERREAEHTAKEEADERRMEIRGKAADPQYAVPVISAIICDEQALIRSYKEDLARENAVTRSSGVTDLGNRRAIGEGMQSAKERIAEWKAALRKNHRAAPKACSDVESVVACKRRDACNEVDKELAEIWSLADDVLRDPARAEKASKPTLEDQMRGAGQR